MVVIKVIKEFIWFRKLIDRHQWYFRNHEFKDVVTHLFKNYPWQLTRPSEIPSLLEQNNILRNSNDSIANELRREKEDQYNKQEQIENLHTYYKNEKLRTEQELVHLKDIIQEKNLVIDQLLKCIEKTEDMENLK